MRTLFCLFAFAIIFGVLAQSPCNVNGCTYEEATDGGSKPAPITFGDYFYTPKCLRVAAGTVITFEGDLEGHPLLSGAFSNI
jgi:plastocyanin